MTTRWLVTLTFVCFACSANMNIYAQSVVSISPNFGYFIFHSDNRLRVTEESNFGVNYGFSATLRHRFFAEHDLQITLGYFRAVARDTKKVPTPGGYSYASLAQSSVPLDISYLITVTPVLSVGLGLSAVFTNRAMTLESQRILPTFEDRFNLIGIGPNGVVTFAIPLSEESTFQIVSETKVRYISSVWFGNKGRDLGSYNLKYLQWAVSIGVGWTF